MDKGKWYIAFFVILFVLPLTSQAQEQKLWVYFTDKGDQSFEPYSFFHPKAIERRIKNDLPIYDFSDIPVNAEYAASLEMIGCSIKMQSRWFNACCVLFEGSVSEIVELPFVKTVVPAIVAQPFSCAASTELSLNSFMIDHALAQTQILGGEYCVKNQLSGKGVRIAVFDVGFTGYKKLPHFKHLRDSGQIEKTWDFIGKDENVEGHGNHGTMVLSCIGGRFQDIPLGLAQDATYLLARTERNYGEYLSEEEHWLEAAEWADKEGVDIINSSLGYTYHRYFYEEMDGKSTIVSRAASMAARKGMLVVNAAGNDGDEDWEYIGAPADADSVLTVGGINPRTGAPISFTSFGPTADQRRKPNVSAFGIAAVASKKGLELVPGTSFASPLIAGLAACIWQENPEMTNMDVFQRIERAGHLFPYFDYSNGYGVPSIARLDEVPDWGNTNVLELEESEYGGKRIWISPADERTQNILKESPQLVYWQVLNENGQITFYQVVEPDGPNGALIPQFRLNGAKTLRMKYKNQYREIDLY